MKRRIIGITGCMGSGKTTVSDILKTAFKAKMIDADEISRIVFKRQNVISDILQYFRLSGIKDPEQSLLDENHFLIRRAVANLVFDQRKDLRHEFEKLVQSYIQDEIYTLVISSSASLIVIDAPIPVEHAFLDIVTEVWIITSTQPNRKKRIKIRNPDWSDKQMQNRIDAQMTQEQYIEKCSNYKIPFRVVPNDSSLDDLTKCVLEILLI